MRYFLLLIFITLYTEINCNNKNKIDEDFIATHEWKVIKEGQKVPQGLHYRINLETGSKEAKLLDQEPTENVRKDLLEVPSKNVKEDLPLDDIKKALKNIKGDNVKPTENDKSKFRSYDQLKEEMSILNLTAKVDAEILKDLFKQHDDEFNKENVEVKVITNILEDFEYLAHQFDNGLEFVNQNGFRIIIYKNLNCSSDKIKESTLRLFGSLVQNNAKVQIHALETGSIPTLLRFFTIDTSEVLKSHAMFALGCLLRRFPLAQQRFIENGGIFVILQLFEKSSLKIQLKIITLMSDLFVEKRQAEENSNHLVINQYKLVNLESELLKQHWCLLVDKLLLDITNTNPDDHDSIEKVLIAMQLISNKCKHFNIQVLKNLKSKYEGLAKVDSKNDDNFFSDLSNLCFDILNYKTVKSEL